MGLGVGQLLLIVLIILIVFGGGKLPKVMGDVGKGMRNLKDNLKEDEKEPSDKAQDTLSHDKADELSVKEENDKDKV